MIRGLSHVLHFFFFLNRIDSASLFSTKDDNISSLLESKESNLSFRVNAAGLSFRVNYSPSLCYVTRNTISKGRVNRAVLLDKRKNNRAVDGAETRIELG